MYSRGGDKLSTKMGRPLKTGQPRNKKLTLALSEDELKEINKCAQILGKPRVDTIVKGVSLLRESLKK